MIETYCKVNETPQKESQDKLIEVVAQYLLNEICSNYEYEWSNACECDKEAFRYYAKELIVIIDKERAK